MNVGLRQMIVVAGAAVALATGAASAQRGGGGGGGGGAQFGGPAMMGGAPAAAPAPMGFGGVRAAAPAPMSGLGGVRAQAPRPLSGINPPRMSLPGPISGIGGVRASFPQTRPLGPAPTSPGFAPMRVGPFPGIDNTQQVPTPLSRPMLPQGGDVNAFVSGGTFASGSGFVSGGGLTVNGAINTDHFRGAIHIGGPFFGNRFCRPFVPFCSFPIFVGGSWWFNNYPFYNGSYYPYVEGSYMQPDQGLVNQPAPAPTQQAAPPMNDHELGDAYLRAGDAKGAVRSYRAFLKTYPGDAAAMRSLGLALIEMGQTKEGVAMIGLAYRQHPNLADTPISIDTFRGGAEDIRDNLRRASVYANRTGAASAWLTVAMFMQAEGRTETARTMIDRASTAGLDAAVVGSMRSALGH
jgi:hypothetical protein